MLYSAQVGRKFQEAYVDFSTNPVIFGLGGRKLQDGT